MELRTSTTKLKKNGHTPEGIHPSSMKTPGETGALQTIAVTCVGLKPLLMARMSPEVLEGIRTKVKPPKGRGKILTPREEAEKGLYLLPNGKPYLPVENVMSALIAAGIYIRLDGKRQLSTAKSSLLPGFMAILDEKIPLFDPETGKEPEWIVDMRRAVNPNGGTVCACRPRFDRWAFRLKIEVDSYEISTDMVRDLFDKAGKRVGLGPMRPSKKGPYGQFRVDGWE